ncbi:MAG: Ig-like domain-containing protein [Pseudomonadales bacterium]|nr:Ig-like domain-containing protein [Pseudomonadales bacterium]
MRIYNAAGVATSNFDIPVNSFTEGDQFSPVITELADGRLAVAWMSAGQDGSGTGIVQTIFNADGFQTNLIANLHISEDQMLGAAVLQFAATANAPQFRLNGTLVDFSAIKDVYGIDVTWNAAANKLILTGAASSEAYESVLHLLTLGTTQSNVSLVLTDLAGNNSETVTGITVSTPGAVIPVAAPTQTVTITGVFASDGAHPGNVPNNGIADDRDLSLSGILSRALNPGQAVLIYDNNTLIDTATVIGTNWTSQYLLFAEGDHVYTARVVNLTGGQGALSNTYVVHIVLDTPVIDTVIDNYAPVLGVVSNGGFTNDPKVVISGHGTAGSTLNLYDNGALVGSTIVDASGHWEMLPPSNLFEGVHSFTAAYIVAITGLIGASSSAYTVTLDITPPSAPLITSITDASATPVLAGGTAGSSTITLKGVAEAGAVIAIHDGNTLLTPATIVTADAGGNWTYTTPVLLDGEHNLSVTAVDAAGNVSAPSYGIALGINTSPIDAPIIYAITDDVGPVQGSFLNGGVTDDTTPTLHGTGAYPSGSVRIFNGAAVLGTVTADADGNWSYTPTLNNHQSVTLSAANVVNGVEGKHSGSWTLTVDTDAPAAPAITQVFDNVLDIFGNVPNGGITNDAQPTVSGTNAVPNSTVNLYDTVAGVTTLIGSASADGSGKWAINVTNTLFDGLHSLSVKATSLAGVEGAASPGYTFTIATILPPTPSFTMGPDTGLFTNDGITKAAVQTLNGSSGSTAGNATITIYDGLIRLGTTTANTDGSWSFATKALTDGEHHLYATATNTAGNISERSEVHSITLDTVAPVVSIGNLVVNTYLPNAQTQPQSARLASGGYVTTWTSAYQDGSGLGVYMQRFDQAGNKVGAEMRVNTYTLSDQSASSVAGLADGSFVVTWQSALQDGGGLGVYMQRFAADGSRLGNQTDTVVNGAFTINDQSMPKVAALAGGRFVIGWDSVGQFETGHSSVFRLYEANGDVVIAGARVNNTTVYSEKFESITALSGGGFVVVYATQLLPLIVYFKVYNADGGVVKTDTAVAGSVNGAMSFDGITALSGGGFATVQRIVETGINIQVYNAAGNLVSGPITLAVRPDDIVQLSNGNIAMVWSENNVIKVQLANASGILQGSPITLTQDPLHDNASPVITPLLNGTFVLSWQTNAGGTYDIVQHLFTNAGVAINQNTQLHFSDTHNLGTVEVNFGAGAAAQPVFRDDSGAVVSYAQILASEGIQVSWDSGSSKLTLTGSASAAVYESLIHMLTTGAANAAVVSIVTTDIAGNSTTTNNITVDANHASVLASSAELASFAAPLSTAGDDVLVVTDAHFAPIDGGAGFDTLKVAGTGLSLNLDKVTGIEQVDLGAGSANTLSVTLLDVLHIPDATPKQLVITGDGSDTVSLKSSDGFAHTAGDTQIKDGVIFDVWHAGAGIDAATLLLQQDLHVVQVA